MATAYIFEDSTGNKTCEGKYCGKEMKVHGNYSKTYKNAVDNGYSVAEATTYCTADRKEELAVSVNTPYSYNGEPVTGYAVISQDNSRPREYKDCELWQNGRNLEDISGLSAGKCKTIFVQNKDNENVDYKQVLDEMGMFASAASQYPHVMKYPEYEAAYNNSHAKFIEQDMCSPASEELYEKYLKSCEGLMKDGCEYIGAIKTPEDIDKVRMSTPSFKEAADEMSKSNYENTDVSSRGTEFDEQTESDKAVALPSGFGLE